MMPGANYFLSKLATHTPGPLVGNNVPKSQPPTTTCLDLVPLSSNLLLDELPSIVTQNASHHIACLPPKDIEVFSGLYSKGSFKQYSTPPENRGTFHTQLPISIKGLEENPVGELQELCTKMRWVFPSYAVCCENGQPHERTFVISVKLYNVREKGEAKSKKAAKREAAQRLLYLLLEKSTGQRFSSETRKKPMVEYRPISDAPPKVSISHQLQQYQDSPSHSKCINMLQELAARRNFHFLFIELDHKPSSGLIQMMLQLSTSPIIVVRGQGSTVLEAKADAALNALECIRITAKKMAFQTINFTS